MSGGDVADESTSGDTSVKATDGSGSDSEQARDRAILLGYTGGVGEQVPDQEQFKPQQAQVIRSLRRQDMIIERECVEEHRERYYNTRKGIQISQPENTAAADLLVYKHPRKCQCTRNNDTTQQGQHLNLTTRASSAKVFDFILPYCNLRALTVASLTFAGFISAIFAILGACSAYPLKSRLSISVLATIALISCVSTFLGFVFTHGHRHRRKRTRHFLYAGARVSTTSIVATMLSANCTLTETILAMVALELAIALAISLDTGILCL